MPPMTLTKPATAGHLALFLGFVEFVAERHALTAEVAQRLKLVVEEAVTNVVHHGYAGREPGDLTLSAEVDGGAVDGAAIVVTLEDEGHAFDPADAPPVDVVSELPDRGVGGLGWHLIRELSDGVAYAAGDPTTGRPNRLTLRVGFATHGGHA